MVTVRHLYIHVPFCARRCVYCDFSIAVRGDVPVDDYLTALACELSLKRARVGPLATLYLGGGTPSKLGGEGIDRLLDVVRACTSLDAGCEVTLEANPEDVTAAAVRAWRAAGVNRLSLGVQSFDDGALAWMHRTHDASAARSAVQVARDNGISNISLDLIFALPRVIERSWARDLDELQRLDVPHASIYGLTVEPRTPLGRWIARHEIEEPAEESFAADFVLAHDRLSGNGFEHYEVSNYGKPGAHSRHNWAYWRRQAYGGVGPSAHEFDGTVRRWNVEAYATWQTTIASASPAVVGEETLNVDGVAAEQIYLGLRTTDGVSLTGAEVSYVRPWIDAGWGRLLSADRLQLTPAGWLRLDSLAASLTAFRSRS